MTLIRTTIAWLCKKYFYVQKVRTLRWVGEQDKYSFTRDHYTPKFVCLQTTIDFLCIFLRTNLQTEYFCWTCPPNLRLKKDKNPSKGSALNRRSKRGVSRWNIHPAFVWLTSIWIIALKKKVHIVLYFQHYRPVETRCASHCRCMGLQFRCVSSGKWVWLCHLYAEWTGSVVGTHTHSCRRSFPLISFLNY